MLIYACSCKRCKRLFRSPVRRELCDDCRKVDEELFGQIEQYLREYPNSNAMQIAEGLSVDVMEVLRFIDEGRLRAAKGSFSRLKD